MIKTFIAYDDIDLKLGEYFAQSHSDLLADLVQNKLISNTSIQGLDCTKSSINATLTALNDDWFIFIALTHGNYNEFVANGVFISAENAHYFANTFFYSTACSTGKNLGEILINNNCHTFIGYDEEISILTDYSSTFYSCENFGIKSFLQNDETVQDSFDKMREFYYSQMLKLCNGSMDDLLAGTLLYANLESLVLLGDKKIMRKDFI